MPAYTESHREANMPSVLVSVIEDECDEVWARILFIVSFFSYMMRA